MFDNDDNEKRTRQEETLFQNIIFVAMQKVIYSTTKLTTYNLFW